MSDTIQERLRAIARQRAEDRVVAEFGPGGGNPNAVPQDHIEWEAADEIDRLHAELAEKDKRIEELTRGVSPYCSGWHFSTDQIDAAWEMWSKYKDMGARAALAELGIVACDKCGGMGVVRSDWGDHMKECDCPNNGWVMEER